MAHPLRNLVAMSTVGLLFVGGVAAAATGTNPLSPLLGANEDAGPVVTTTTTTTIGTTTTTAAADAAALDDEVDCPDDVANHGEAVSEVAHDKTNVGAEHGAAVSAMAQSDCGKTDGTDGDDDENEERAAHQSSNKSAKNKAHHNDDDDDDDDSNELGS
jgi:hypothetical protein